MNVLPSQKLTISQMFLGLAAGLMLFLLPNDAKDMIGSEGLCEAYILLISLVITTVLFLITKRYEAVGLSLLTMSCLTAASILIEIIKGVINDASTYWPDINKYRIVSMFLLWFVPFAFCMIVRLLSRGSSDNNDTRRGFAKFMSISMKALLIIYVVVVLFKLIMPERPSVGDRNTELMIFARITQCINGTHENGIPYILWHCIVLAPLSLYLSVLVPKFRIWQITIIAASFGLATEVMQYIFNTGTACTDDILMLIIGAILGILFKRSVDKLRSMITNGEDPDMLSFEYNHMNIKPKGEAQVLTEE